MKNVLWIMQCQTLVNVDDDEEARKEVNRLFDGQTFSDDAGKCLATVQAMAVMEVLEADVETEAEAQRLLGKP